MSSPQENTKIEQITESIESLIVASVHLALAQAKVKSHDDFDAARVSEINTGHASVTDARENLSASLRDFLKPTLRIVAPEREPYPKHRTLGDQMMGCGND